MKKNNILLLIGGSALVIFFATAWYVAKNISVRQSAPVVISFEQCRASGNRITNSYPRECIDAAGKRFIEQVRTAAGKSDVIVIDTPAINQKISSPVTVSGRARGSWFFEASFPIKLVDAEGKILGTAIAQAQGDWMTTEFVPFTALLAYTAPVGTDNGQLIFQRDNPSGLPENEDDMRMPVYIASTDERVVKVYFGKAGASEADCGNVFAVERTVPFTQAIARATLEELLKGATQQEKSDGYFTSLNPDVSIQKLTVDNGIASVDFSSALNIGVAGSCRVTAIRAQISQTLLQFPTVKQVVISVDDRTEDILQP